MYITNNLVIEPKHILYSSRSNYHAFATRPFPSAFLAAKKKETRAKMGPSIYRKQFLGQLFLMNNQTPSSRKAAQNLIDKKT